MLNSGVRQLKRKQTKTQKRHKTQNTKLKHKLKYKNTQTDTVLNRR